MAEKEAEQTTEVAPLTGRAAVRVLLIERLDQAGLAKPRKVSVDAHEVGQKRACDHLAYMDPENLMTLAEVLIGVCKDGFWPAEFVIRQMAESLQPAPALESRIFQSWLASIEGPKAELDGTLVELYRFLKAKKMPPGPVDKRLIAERSADNARFLELVKERIEVPAEEQARWDAYRRDEAAAREIVDGGKKKREGTAA